MKQAVMQRAAFFIFGLKFGLTATMLALAVPAAAETWHFALIGDTPYSEHERRELPKMLAAIADRRIGLIAHIGDIKHGQDRCDDSVFEDRFRLFNSSRIPFVFVPGDNEWTDCNRPSNGAYEPLERLGKLRQLFWATDLSLGQKKISLERQTGGFPEHARFRFGPVLFVTLNLPGGNNNFLPTGKPGTEYRSRNPGVLAWLRDSFALAKRENLAGIVVLFQADPGFTNLALGYPNPYYREFLEALRDETLAFAGQVLAVHGDTHISRIDQPLRDKRGGKVRHFVRLETFGYPDMGWTHAIIDSESPTLFRFEPHRWLPSGP